MFWLTRLRVVAVVLTGGGPVLLTDWWAAAPDWAIERVRRACGVDVAAAHEWLCPTLGCRCPTPAAEVAGLDDAAAGVPA